MKVAHLKIIACAVQVAYLPQINANDSNAAEVTLLPLCKVLLLETRKVTVQLLEKSEWLMIIDIQLKAEGSAVTLGKTPFGMIGVRMAKTIGVNDGGGRIRR